MYTKLGKIVTQQRNLQTKPRSQVKRAISTFDRLHAQKFILIGASSAECDKDFTNYEL